MRAVSESEHCGVYVYRNGVANPYAKPKAKAMIQIQPIPLTQQQAVNPNPVGLQQKVRLVVYLFFFFFLGVHSYDNDNQTMKSRACTEAIRTFFNKFVSGSVNFKHSVLMARQ